MQPVSPSQANKRCVPFPEAYNPCMDPRGSCLKKGLFSRVTPLEQSLISELPTKAKILLNSNLADPRRKITYQIAVSAVVPQTPLPRRRRVQRNDQRRRGSKIPVHRVTASALASPS
jgi:hypothetical protein